MAAMQQQKKMIRWGELEDDDGYDLDFLLPPRLMIGPDENGIKKTIEYKFDEQGNKVRVTTTTSVRKIASTRVSKKAKKRRSWAKFGDAAKEDAGARLTMVSTEEIFLEHMCAPGSKAEEPSASGSGDTLGLAGKGSSGVLMVSRACGKKGEHWTSKCPYKDLAAFAESPPTCDDGPGPAPPSPANNEVYVPLRLRVGPTDLPRHDMRCGGRNDENSVRVTNLSKDAHEPDLHELFGSFRPVTRAYIAVDRITGQSRGLRFVSFVHREDGEKAIAKLNGYGYGNLILRVEWAAPRPN